MTSRLKAIIKRSLSLMIQPIFNFLFRLQFRRSKNKKLCVVDIDNTIADTWQALSDKNVSTYSVLRNVRAFPKMREYINSYQEDGYSVIFLTVRNYAYVFVTRNWLKANGFPVTFSNVILADRPETKADLLAKHAGKYKIVYIDDLSFGHETGKVKYYTNTIERIMKLPITYIGYDEIRSVNED